MADHIHHLGDGRGQRKVFVNDNEVERAVYADTVRGVVFYIPSPPRLHKNKKDEIYTRRLKGRVDVVPLNGGVN